MTDALQLFLVEDDDAIALLIRRTLERAGHQVTRCRTGADALIVLGQTAFDLVVLDQRLPDMSGLDLLRTFDREGIMAPVLMVTGAGDERLATEVLRAGALDYMVKDGALTFLAELPKRVTESVTRHRLEQTNQLLVQALESTRDGILITDLQGIVLEVNRALEALTGYTREELLGKTAFGEKGLTYSSPPLSSKPPSGPAVGPGAWRRKSRAESPKSRAESPKSRAEGPESRARSRRGVAALDSGLSALDYLGSGALGTPPGMQEEIWQALLNRNSWQGEPLATRKDGSRFEASMTFSPIVDRHGRLTHFVGILRDVSGRKQLERQLFQAQKMQSVGTLAGGVAHEFNNLLAGINGYAALALREAGLGDAVQDFLRRVVDLSERAAGLTRQMLAFARKSPLVREPVALAPLLHDTADLVSRTTHQHVGVLIAPGVDEQTLFVEGDANQIQQALVNLALNACDAILARREARGESPEPERNTPPVLDSRLASLDSLDEEEEGPHKTEPSRITFRLASKVLEEEQPAFPQNVPPGDYVVIEARDQGVGMSTEVLARALDPFFTTKEVGKGTGLGLPVVFGIVQGHQAHITIASTLGQGTRIHLYFPRIAEKSLTRGVVEEPAPFAAGETVEPDEADQHHILVIDDEVAVLDVVRRFLEIAGHRVTCASSGRQALEVLPRIPSPDLILLDLMTPGENPLTTFRRLRHRRPTIPVLVCTGLSEAEPAPELLKEPHVSLIRKPFRMNELWYAVRNALEAVES
jgi:DNA-binding response OmpR family regulator/signal transduction histidine kinase